MTPEDYMRQAHMTAGVYMNRGIEDISFAFNVPMFSREHLDLCKSILPSYMQVAAKDFEVGMKNYERKNND